MQKNLETKTKLWTKDFTLICIINFLIFMNHIMLFSTFPFYISSLGGTDAVAGIATALFCVIAVICRPFVGWMIDTRGRRIVLFAGIAGMAVMPFGYAVSSVLSTVLIFRMLQGAFLSCSNTACSTIASDTIPEARFAEGMGMFGMSNAVATASAPALGLLLMHKLNFRALFIAAIVSMVIAFVLNMILKAPETAVKSKPIDFKNLIDRNALPASAALLIFLLTFGSIEAFIAKFADESGLPGGGVFFAIMAVVTVFTRITTGKLADKKGEGIFIYTCNISMFAAMMLLGSSQNTLSYIISAVLAGYGFGGITPALQAMAVHIAEPSRRGAANSTFLCAYDIGIGFGAGVAGVLITSYGYGMMFEILAIANIVSILCYVLYGKKHPSSFSYSLRQ